MSGSTFSSPFLLIVGVVAIVVAVVVVIAIANHSKKGGS